MKRKLGRLLLAVGVALGLMAFQPQTSPPDLSSPKATVRSFLNAVKARDTDTIRQCIKGEIKPDLVRFIFADPNTLRVFAVGNMIAETENDTAHVAAEITLTVPASPGGSIYLMNLKQIEMFLVMKQGNRWLLTQDPDLAQQLRGGNSVYEQLADKRPLALAVTFASNPELESAVRRVHDQAMANTCLSNMRQVVLGLVMYAQDHNEHLPPKVSEYTDLIHPYLKNKLLYTCPLDAKGIFSYKFNSNLQGAALDRIPAPAQTVILYEGKEGKFEYRHSGKTIVGFADGHAKALSPDETKGLIWTLEAPAATAPKPVR